MDRILSSDITNYLFTLKSIRKLPINVQEIFYQMSDIFLSDSSTQEEKDGAFYTILDIWEL